MKKTRTANNVVSCLLIYAAMPYNFLRLGFVAALFMLSCSAEEHQKHSITVFQTSQTGDNLKMVVPGETNLANKASQVEVKIRPEETFQSYCGFGASFTESSAWNLATIPVALRKEVMTKLFSPTDGAGFTLTRTHINSSDYSNGHYTYVEEGDEDLATFSVLEDMKGFTGDENDQVQGIQLEDPQYDLIPMMLEALAVPGADVKIIASPWSPPSWMKENETGEMTNGSLKPMYYSLWAKYLSKYVSAYKEQGIDLWGMTPQNEPLHAHDARWDSNGFSPAQGRDFLRDHLGPQLVKDGHLNLADLNDGLRLLIYDHNKSTMNNYVTPTYEDPEASKYAWGTAFHWYASSQLEENGWFTDDLDELRNKWPQKGMIHTESSLDIDPADPIGQYWRESTDYAGSMVPFDTYAYDIISDMNHGAQGYIEWCMILSHQGQPNPYNNYNSAPVLINPATDEVIYTPLYYLLSHFSKFIRPEATRIGLESSEVEGLIYTAARNEDGSIVLIAFNKGEETHSLSLLLEGNTYAVNIGPRTMQTVVFDENKPSE